MDFTKKHTINVHMKEAYFLGTGKSGLHFYMQKESWECDWFWSFGYIATYTNNDNPEKSSDTRFLQHFDSLFLGKNLSDPFINFFCFMPLSSEERYQLLELMQTAYTLRATARLFDGMGCNSTVNPCSKQLVKPEVAEEINTKMIPAVMQEVRKILT
ncbi:MAG: hypothetical protein NC347_00300 [Clostridium sp.]|nr:hypothetical protein [Clostridium sp.]